MRVRPPREERKKRGRDFGEVIQRQTFLQKTQNCAFIEQLLEPEVVVDASNPRIWEVEARGLGIQGECWL